MLSQKLVFSLSFSIILLLSCDPQTADPNIEDTSEDVELIDVEYGDEELQKFDLFLPENRSKETTKVIVFVHGGGWVEGDKGDIQGYYEYLKEFTENYAIANLNYRLGDLAENPLPMQMEDISTFITYFKENAEDYSVNPTFAFVGLSAGAHLSMLYSYKNDENSDIQVIGNIVGPTDFTHSSYSEATDEETIELISNVEIIMGLPIEGNEAYYRSISPRYLVESSTVPTISFYGGLDLLVPEQQGEILRDELESNGVINNYIFYPEGGHGWGDPDVFDTLDRIISFVGMHL